MRFRTHVRESPLEIAVKCSRRRLNADRVPQKNALVTSESHQVKFELLSRHERASPDRGELISFSARQLQHDVGGRAERDVR